MSGNALAGKCPIERIPNANSLCSLASSVSDALMRNSGSTKVVALAHRHLLRTLVLTGSDQTYGDLDFVVDQDYLEEAQITPQQIAKALGSKAWAENGQVWSFEFSGHQVDFIRVPGNSIRLNSVLYGHGGAGYLLRLLARPYGMRLRDDGLKEILYDGNHKIAEVLIENEMNPILNLIGFTYYGNYSFSRSGFRSREDAYNHILNCRSFTLGAFDINENYEYVGKPERLEYPPLRGFIEYVKVQADSRNRALTNPPLLWPLTPTPNQKKSLNMVLKGYASYYTQRRAVIEDYRRDRLLRSKFNGEMVMDATGLMPGPDLSRFMEAYRGSFGGRGAFEFHILSSMPDTIQESMQRFYADYRKAEEEKPEVPELIVTKRRPRKKVDLAVESISDLPL